MDLNWEARVRNNSGCPRVLFWHESPTSSDHVVISVAHDTFFFQHYTWWRHQMETFSALLTICAGNSTVPGEFPTQRPVTRSFDVFFDLRLNKRLSKQPWGWWFETLSRPLWRHRNEHLTLYNSWCTTVHELPSKESHIQCHKNVYEKLITDTCLCYRPG